MSIWFALTLGVPATILLLIQAVTADDGLLPYSSALEAVLYFYAAGALIAYMLADHDITRDELWAVGATFTLVAWAFAYTYTVVQAVEPHSFTAAVDPQDPRSWMELLFLSFTTLTSTGRRGSTRCRNSSISRGCAARPPRTLSTTVTSPSTTPRIGLTPRKLPRKARPLPIRPPRAR